MPTRVTKELVSSLEKLGFDYLWSNGKGFLCYVHPDDPGQTEVSVSPSMKDETQARRMLESCRKLAGQLPQIEKRKGQQIKDRHAAERERAERRLEWAEAKEARLLADRTADAEHLRRITELVQLRRAELRELHRLMAESPQGAQHVGRGRVEIQGTARDRTPL